MYMAFLSPKRPTFFMEGSPPMFVFHKNMNDIGLGHEISYSKAIWKISVLTKLMETSGQAPSMNFITTNLNYWLSHNLDMIFWEPLQYILEATTAYTISNIVLLKYIWLGRSVIFWLEEFYLFPRYQTVGLQ